MVRYVALLLALALTAVGCASDLGPTAADGQDDAAFASDGTTLTAVAVEDDSAGDLGDGSTTSAPKPDSEPDSDPAVTSPELEVTVPVEEPVAAGFTVTETGDGPIVETGDEILAAWEMLAVKTGEVVESTADDFGGPVPIAVGAGFVPVALDQALIGQTVGTRLDVQFPAGMNDLPEYLDADQSYVLAVQIVELLDAEEQTAATTPQTTTATTITAASDPGLFVPPTGPLTANPPSGAALPTRNSSRVILLGDGVELAEGDTVELEYVVVSWSTGEVVRSTAGEPGGTQTIVLGDIEVPRIMENGIFRQPVGSRVQVIYAPDLPDMPDGLDLTDAYVVAVDIIASN